MRKAFSRSSVVKLSLAGSPEYLGGFPFQISELRCKSNESRYGWRQRMAIRWRNMKLSDVDG
jgi:hypothetical protein